MYLKDRERWVAFAFKAGADTHPHWYYGLMAHPEIQVEVGDETIDVHAEGLKGVERVHLSAVP
jgi:hypothetical protein